MSGVTLFSVLSGIFTAICIICYINVVVAQKNRLKEGTKRLQVDSLENLS